MSPKQFKNYFPAYHNNILINLGMEKGCKNWTLAPLITHSCLIIKMSLKGRFCMMFFFLMGWLIWDYIAIKTEFKYKRYIAGCEL